ncbi:hypothetical protein AYO45_06880 [Gammaproteobacteria bacterium SCGC AG-212-F23]|nr:hypothetical protein AYO45_06880 [Gammaproteobacteria bacterium SCGC AG-212-F23]
MSNARINKHIAASISNSGWGIAPSGDSNTDATARQTAVIAEQTATAVLLSDNKSNRDLKADSKLPNICRQNIVVFDDHYSHATTVTTATTATPTKLSQQNSSTTKDNKPDKIQACSNMLNLEDGSIAYLTASDSNPNYMLVIFKNNKIIQRHPLFIEKQPHYFPVIRTCPFQPDYIFFHGSSITQDTLLFINRNNGAITKRDNHLMMMRNPSDQIIFDNYLITIKNQPNMTHVQGSIYTIDKDCQIVLRTRFIIEETPFYPAIAVTADKNYCFINQHEYGISIIDMRDKDALLTMDSATASTTYTPKPKLIKRYPQLKNSAMLISPDDKTLFLTNSDINGTWIREWDISDKTCEPSHRMDHPIPSIDNVHTLQLNGSRDFIFVLGLDSEHQEKYFCVIPVNDLTKPIISVAIDSNIESVIDTPEGIIYANDGSVISHPTYTKYLNDLQELPALLTTYLSEKALSYLTLEYSGAYSFWKKPQTTVATATTSTSTLEVHGPRT